MTIAEALRQAVRLASVSDTARLDTELLLSAASGHDRTYFYTWPERELTPEVTQTFEEMLAQREAGHPIAHLTGQREFWSLSLAVDDSTLIPRPDTEVLVETALAHLPDSATHMIDLGTGTGAIALALATEKPNLKITAVDQSEPAVALAKKNATALAVNSVQFACASWLDAGWVASLKEASFDLVVSNPPYIDANDPHLGQGDVRFEPLSALVADDEGLSDIRVIVALAQAKLKPGGFLWLEHGWQQAALVAEILSTTGFERLQTVNDYGGNPRVTGGQKA